MDSFTLAGMAAEYERRGQFAKAAAWYQDAADKATTDSERTDMQYCALRCRRSLRARRRASRRFDSRAGLTDNL